MANTYNLKIVVSGKQVEVFKYKKPVWRDYKKKDNNNNTQKEPIQLNAFKQLEIKKQKAIFSLNRTKTEIRRLTNANPQLNKFMTLTFAKNITSLKEANYIFNQFVKRILYKYPDFEYLAVPEFQKRGAVHYHLLCRLPFMEISELEFVWGQGFIRVNEINNVNNIGAYVCKYLSKDMFDDRTFGKKKFFHSQTLKKAIELMGYWAIRFLEKFLNTVKPVFEKIFESEWTGEVEYKAYSLEFIPFRFGVFDKSIFFNHL
ncbi:MAG: rolling circle replication-associated protein [Candidatus Komeilibacteria bacterium]